MPRIFSIPFRFLALLLSDDGEDDEEEKHSVAQDQTKACNSSSSKPPPLHDDMKVVGLSSDDVHNMNIKDLNEFLTQKGIKRGSSFDEWVRKTRRMWKNR